MNRIRECRINSKLSQKYVAMTLDVAGPSVSNWESGKTQPTPDNLKRLAALFGVTVDYLLGNDEMEQIPETKKEPAPMSEPRMRLMNELDDLEDHEVQRVLDFVSGVRSKKEPR